MDEIDWMTGVRIWEQ